MLTSAPRTENRVMREVYCCRGLGRRAGSLSAQTSPSDLAVALFAYSIENFMVCEVLAPPIRSVAETCRMYEPGVSCAREISDQ